MYTMYSNASNNTPSYTKVSSYVEWRVHPQGAHSSYEAQSYVRVHTKIIWGTTLFMVFSVLCVIMSLTLGYTND